MNILGQVLPVTYTILRLEGERRKAMMIMVIMPVVMIQMILFSYGWKL
jgi:ABC-type spermidine/putrescine transport system permease subunit I